MKSMANFEEPTFLFLTILLSYIFLLLIKNKLKRKPHLPPSPRALPVIGHLHLLSRLPHQAFHNLSTQHGPLIHLYLGSKLSVIASSPEMARQFLKLNETSFLNRPKMTNLDFLSYGTSDFAMAPYGPYWKSIKKLCMTQLLGGRALQLHSHIRRQELKQLLDTILTRAHANESVNLGEELVKLTNNVISRMAFRRRCSGEDGEAGEVRRLVKELTELGRESNMADLFWFCKNLDLQGFGRRLKEARDRFDCMIERIIEEHQEARKSGDDAVEKDILDILLDIFEDETSEIRLTRENIKAFIMNMFGAGTDTSSAAAEWALSELINHPMAMAKAQKEMDSVVGKSRVVEESDIPNLPYLQAIVKETLRLHPTGPLIARESTSQCQVGGYDIPPKTRLFVNIWALGRDPNHWESPLEFKPERFGGEKGDVELRGQQFHMIPFGSGRRSCPGASLALHMVHASVGAMIQCFEWRVCGGKSTSSVDMEEGVGVTLPRANPLVCKPLPRLHPFPSFG